MNDMMHNILSSKWIAVLFCCIFSTLSAQDNVIDRVEWVVGDKAILRSDIESAILFWYNNDRKFEGDPYCIVGEDLAVQQLFLHQAGLDSIVVGELEIMKEVDARVEQTIARAGSKEKMEEYMGMSSRQIREMYYEQVENMLLMGRMKHSIIGDIKVSPALVRKYYNNLSEDSIPYIPSQVEVQIITQKPEIELSEIERIKSELRGYAERVNSGETSFSTLALLYSEDKGSARRGGELDFMGKGELAPEFAAVAFGMTDPNKVSKIVETEFGYHIIQLVEKRGDRIKVRHILRTPQVSTKNVDYMLSRLDSIKEDIDSGRCTFEDGVWNFSQDKDTKNNYGIMFNMLSNSSSSKFELKDLPVEVASVVEKMKVGDVSKPFVMVQSNGRTVCAIVKLKNRIDGHKANLKDDYEHLKEMYMEKVGEDKINRWIKNKQKNTYVRINNDSRKCEFVYPDWIFHEDK